MNARVRRTDAETVTTAVRDNLPRGVSGSRPDIESSVIRRYRSLWVLLALLVTTPGVVSAQWEVEVDPFAYGLNGFSLHVAGVLDEYRLSAGTFGIDVPRFFHGNDGWSASMRGVGIKTDVFGSRSDGYFVGADANYYRMSYTLDRSGETIKRDELGVGVRAGFRQPLGDGGFYVAPWVGIGYNFGDGAVVSGTETFSHNPITIFPTVHIGWRF